MHLKIELNFSGRAIYQYIVNWNDNWKHCSTAMSAYLSCIIILHESISLYYYSSRIKAGYVKKWRASGLGYNLKETKLEICHTWYCLVHPSIEYARVQTPIWEKFSFFIILLMTWEYKFGQISLKIGYVTADG